MKMIRWNKQKWEIGKFEEVEVLKVTDTNVYLANGRRTPIETKEFDCYAPTLEEARAAQIKHWEGMVGEALAMVAYRQTSLDKARGITERDPECMHCAIGQATQAQVAKFPNLYTVESIAKAMGRVMNNILKSNGIDPEAGHGHYRDAIRAFAEGAGLQVVHVAAVEVPEAPIHPGNETRN